ncbi:MAG: hypothetical protein J3R72DRAFT_443505 [Linnemannia gamsii]|nr:MAG: hypothetical protein J3R72DRAFT_443505 [Linnemannia gamsii]
MIISTYFWVASFTISIIKIILSGAIGAIFGFYVKYCRDEFSNSIRWSRTGGFHEMIALYRNSRGRLARRSRAVMILMIFASLFTFFVSILLGASISRTKSTVNPANKGVSTQQPAPTFSAQWTDWIAYMEADATMEVTMISLLNDTGYNPSPSSQTIYTPRTQPYDVPCTETGAVIAKNHTDMPFLYRSLHDNCKVAFLILDGLSYDWDHKRASNQLISPSLHMVVAPTFFLDGRLFDIQPLFEAYYGKFCKMKGPPPGLFNAFPKDGLTALPRTVATRCQFGSDDSLVLAATYIKFAVNHLSDFNKVTSMIFDDPSNLPLLKYMSASIDNGTFASPTNNSTMVLLTNMSDNVDFLVCASIFLGPPNDMGLFCTYMATATIATKPQLWDSIITADLNRNSTLPADPESLINQNDINVYHMTLGSRNNMTTYSAAHLLEATTNATEYLASLGHNVIMNRETGSLYILYDTVELTDAFEVSTALLIVLGFIVVICGVIWGISGKKYPVVFNGSLYMLIYQDIKSKEEKTPMLMDFKHGPLAFDGYQVIPDLDEQDEQARALLQVDLVVVPATESAQQPLVREIPMQAIQMQQSSTQQLPMESEIFVQSQSWSAQSCPTTIDANNSTGATHIITFPVQTSSFLPTMAPPIPPRPFKSHRNFTPAYPIQLSPPLHTTTHSIQNAPSPPSANQESTLIQNPFW